MSPSMSNCRLCWQIPLCRLHCNAFKREPLTVEEQLAITEIAAPPFQEKRRADDYLKRLLDIGLSDAYIDSEGNVVGYRRGTGKGPPY